jgi:hypothetical protein
VLVLVLVQVLIRVVVLGLVLVLLVVMLVGVLQKLIVVFKHVCAFGALAFFWLPKRQACPYNRKLAVAPMVCVARSAIVVALVVLVAVVAVVA